jgi:diguanylate cyclase (GGDEF)-like protein
MEVQRPEFSSAMRTRILLVTVQLLFTVIFADHLVRALPASRLHNVLLASVIVLTVTLLLVPRRQIATIWFIAFLSLGDMTALLQVTQAVPAIEPWMTWEILLLMVTVSYAPSVPAIVVLSGLVSGSYALSLYRLGLFETEHVFLLPVLLCVTLAFAGKTRNFQTELERVTDTDTRARYKTMTDALTGLPNRAQFLEHVEHAIQRSHTDRHFQFAVLFIDLDGFKPINDRLGHKAGDAVLQQAAKRFQVCMRKGDTVGRYGGDEFTLLVNDVTSDADAIRVAERILAKLKQPIEVGEPAVVGASIGIAVSSPLHERPEELIRDADAAMYRAKKQGKNQYVISEPIRDVSKTELKDRLQRAQLARW